MVLLHKVTFIKTVNRLNLIWSCVKKIRIYSVGHSRIMIPRMTDCAKASKLTIAMSCDPQDQRVSTLIPWRTDRCKYGLITFIFRQ